MKTLKLTKKYQTYSEYKNSGIGWVGDVPEKWEVVRGKTIFRNKKYLNTGIKNDNVLSLTMRGVINRDVESNEGLLPGSYETFQIFEKDDLVFKLIDLENYKTSRVGIVHEKGIMSPVYIRLVSIRNNFPKYFYYLYYSFYLQGIYNFLGSGVRSALNPYELMEMEILTPSIDEQKTIANFLDQKTALIDTIIEKKKKQIELLKEKRTAVINQAVTKGLDLGVEMVDSGIEWIGKIPKGWEVKKIKHITGIEYGDALPTDTRIEGQIPVFGSNGSVGNHNEANTKSPVILIGRKGSYGAVNYSEVEVYAIDTTYFIDNRSTNQNLKWLYYGLGCVNLSDFSQDTGIPGLSRSDAYEKFLPVPNVEGQKILVNYLDRKSEEFSMALKKVEKSIELLQEFKSSLITNAVTGKIKI